MTHPVSASLIASSPYFLQIKSSKSVEMVRGYFSLDELPGDDLFGLQAGFFAAGARGVVGSLWPVESKEAYKIMLAFHGGLLAGLPPARALQASVQRWLQAKRDERRQKNPTTPFNPGQYVHHWAPFFLTALGHFPSLLSQGG
jgi:CHAT domain-containing protein